jgi:hypothetical protein
VARIRKNQVLQPSTDTNDIILKVLFVVSVMAAALPSSRICSAVPVANRCMARAMMPVQPVWWLVPRPAP